MSQHVEPGNINVPDYGATSSYAHKHNNDASAHENATSVSSSEDDNDDTRQAGVKTIEAVSRVWTGWSLACAYIGVYLMAFSTSLEGQTTSYLTAYATSALGAHALTATIATVQSVFYSVVKPPIAKFSDVFGRFEGFALAIFLYVIGYIMEAAAGNIDTFAAAQLFYAAGSTGLQILQQIFIADTSNLLNRALFSTIPDLPFLATVWIGPLIAEDVYNHVGWRWGYGLWAIVLPVAFLPLALSLILNKRKAGRLGLLPSSPFADRKCGQILKYLWIELDFFGLLLLSAAECLVLIPLTIATRASGGWGNPSIIAMLVVGGLCAVAFPFWERSKKLAPRAFFPLHLFRNKTLVAGVSLAFFYFAAFYLSVQPYFYSYLLVVQNESIAAAGHIVSIFSFSSTITSFVVSLLIKYTGHYKYFITVGACIYLMGLGLMIKYRAPDTTTGAIVGCQIAVGIGGGMLNVPAQLGVQASVRHQEVASATAVFLTILEIGGAVGSAISGAVWTNNILPKLELYLPAETKSQASAIYADITLASTGWAPGTPTRIAIDRAYQETMDILLIIAICVAAMVIPLSLLMTNYDLKKIDQNVTGRIVGGVENNQSQTTSDNSTDTAEAKPPSRLSRLLRCSAG